MSNEYNTLVLTDEEFGNNLYIEVSNILRILTKANYVCVVREEEVGIIRIDYNYDSHLQFGNAIPVWCDERELEIINFCLDYYKENDSK